MTFLNSQQWRDFQESVGRKTFDLGKGYAAKLDIPLGKNYLYSNYTEVPKYLDEIKKIAKKENAIFFKFEPRNMEHETLNIKHLESKGFKQSKKELQPQKTIILDLKKSEGELLSQMHEKTRYNIRLAKKRGVRVIESQDKQKDFKKFWQLLSETARRDKFYTHPKNYYKKLLNLDMAKLYFARKEDKLAAAAVVIFWNDTATYLHGASDYALRKHMAPHLMHWNIIQDAKKRGFEKYDLWGIDDKKWPGMTRFKRGFGGKEAQYAGSWDLPLRKFWYGLYKLKNEITS